MKIKEIFTPGSLPTHTFVDEHLEDKGQQLKDALDDGSMLISISGPSKSGKTVFIEHLIGKEVLIQITGAGINSAEDFYRKVFHIIGTPLSEEEAEAKSSSNQISGKGKVQGNAIVAKGSAEVGVSDKRSKSNSKTKSTALDYLQVLIKELGNTEYVVFIDDFHYIPKDVQEILAQQLKEAIRKNVKLIAASVPYHSDDVIRSNPDLRGRIFSIDFDYWGSEFLRRIPEKGFGKANINCDDELINKLVAESAGSPQLMQYLCLNTCYISNTREVSKNLKELKYNEDFFTNICERTVLSTDYSSVVNKMIEGPKTRGSDRKIHITKYDWQSDVYKILLKAVSEDPPKLNYRYQPLVDRISSICKDSSPSGSSITSACLHATAIANDTARDNIIEWDSENDVLDIRDPYLLFYLRWADIF